MIPDEELKDAAGAAVIAVGLYLLLSTQNLTPSKIISLGTLLLIGGLFIGGEVFLKAIRYIR